MARALEPFRDPRLPERLHRWIEVLRQRIVTVPCFTYSDGSPEGVITGQRGDLYYDRTGSDYYYKSTDTGDTGWIVFATGGASVTLQDAYDASADGNIVIDATRGSVSIQDSSPAQTPPFTLFEVLDDAGVQLFDVTTSSGNVNAGPRAGTGRVNVFHNASQVMESIVEGIGIRGTAGATNTKIAFYDTLGPAATRRAFIGSDGLNQFNIVDELLNRPMRIGGTSSGGIETFLLGTPNGDTLLQGNTGIRLQTASGVIRFRTPATRFEMNSAGQLDLLGNGTQSGILRITEGTSEFATLAGTGQLWADSADGRLQWTDSADVQNELAYISDLGLIPPAGSVEGDVLAWDGSSAFRVATGVRAPSTTTPPTQDEGYLVFSTTATVNERQPQMQLSALNTTSVHYFAQTNAAPDGYYLRTRGTVDSHAWGRSNAGVDTDIFQIVEALELQYDSPNTAFGMDEVATVSQLPGLTLPTGSVANNALRWDGAAWVEVGGFQINASGDILVENTSPQIWIRDTNATADEGNWTIRGDADLFRIQTNSDAAPESGVVNAISWARSGTEVGLCTIRGNGITLNDLGGNISLQEGGVTRFQIDNSNGRVVINDYTLFMEERAAALADVAGYGQLWVQDLVPNRLVFTDDAGGDNTLAYVSEIPSLAGFAQISGTPVNNQLAIWTGATDIEGDVDLTFDGSELLVGAPSASSISLRMSSAGGYVIRAGATTGGWARGLIPVENTGGARLGGIGWLGNNETVTYAAIGFGADWWATDSTHRFLSGGQILMAEVASAAADVTGYGQLWIDSADSRAKFTGDNGVDNVLAFVSELPAAAITQLTGDVTAGPGSGSQVATIPNDTVTNAQLANMAGNTVKVRTTGSGDPQDLLIGTNRILGNVAGVISSLDGSQVNTMLPNFTSGLDGLAPASGGGTANFLRADGTWAIPPGTGSGNVSNTGTPVNNQLAIWTDATTIEGQAALTWDNTKLDIDGIIALQERSAPGSDVAGEGQIWVDDRVENLLYFTNDVGDDFALNPICVRKPSDESLSNSTTLQNDDHLNIQNLPAGFYRVTIYMLFRDVAVSNCDARMRIVGTSVSSTENHARLSNKNFSGTGAPSFDEIGLITDTFDNLNLVNGSGTSRFLYVGYARIFSNGGFQVQWAQQTAQVGALEMEAGSWMIVEHLGNPS